MEGSGANADPAQAAPSDNATAGEAKRHGKGKEKAATFGDRLQASGRMALNATVAAQPTLAGSSNGKTTVGLASASQGSISEFTQSEASRHHGTPGLADSLRHNSQASSQTSVYFDQFLNAAPQMQGPIQPTPQSGPAVQSPSFREQTATDGADVVQLLGMSEEEPIYSEIDELLSEQEVASLREALFNNGASHTTLNRLLSFKPEFVLSPNGTHEAKSLMGTEDTTIAHGAWLRQWHDVLTSYTDKVWGSLGSLVDEARHEVETMESHADTRSPEAKALGRLQQILAHVRGQF